MLHEIIRNKNDVLYLGMTFHRRNAAGVFCEMNIFVSMCSFNCDERGLKTTVSDVVVQALPNATDSFRNKLITVRSHGENILRDKEI